MPLRRGACGGRAGGAPCAPPAVAADTTVVINGEIIGKPVDLDDARRMIKKLAGNWHEVLTGVELSHLFWQPDYERLLTLANLDGYIPGDE